MEIRDLCDEIVELCYHSAAISDDDYVQERATHAGIWDLIQQYTDQLELKAEADATDSEIRSLESQLEEARAEIEDLAAQVSRLEARLELAVESA